MMTEEDKTREEVTGGCEKRGGNVLTQVGVCLLANSINRKMP